MTITLISEKQYDELLEIFTNYPSLTYQNKGYDGINKDALSDEEKLKFNEVDKILKTSIEGFSYFQNFKLNKKDRIQLRFQYRYDASFTGVGYILLDELLNGFEK